MKIRLSPILLLSILIGCKQEYKTENTTVTNIDPKKEILLIGTFHYNNPGADVAKTKSFDILSEKSQLELEGISSSIIKYNPTKVFVEWPFKEQSKLDSLYALYKENNYFTNESLSDFYLKNEIFQLAFRVAKGNNLDKVYAIDYPETKFPYQEVMHDIESTNQLELKERIEKTIAQFTTEFDNMIESGASLKELTFAMNTKQMRDASNDLHINMFSLAGSTNDFNGVYLTSEWYKRNLYMWSLIQKYTSVSDERVMVLAGSSHTAMIDLFVKENRDWKIKELKEIINEK
ncbi:DUF5694 domain-containing protein [Rhodocytophaga aerolata]|uniref:DUF5694 domain-containing protein n=1 Tax=Rhodocytophaga aerolata TaxID=455078 RepID=A0ABT8RAJ3_9BACT|nr:DUF5694 domain-containing protein [Rhodocytophaga aerolata]MDO1449118.1 DUF5694 domain-containing protein [Rhodocytophaga aerolata]